jgi:UV DNA damage endonuclease
MKIGYPCINRSIGCTANSTFRLASYSKEKLIEKVDNNLNCILKILEYNLEHNILFFRISSELVPFASHPVCKFNWRKHFQEKFEFIGKFIKKYKMRINMHPDQFILINAQKPDIIKRSIKELEYHCDVLDLFGLDSTAKIQIHVGGVYGEKEKSIQRFCNTYKKLSQRLLSRLCIENDEHSYCLKDCLNIHKQTKIPVIFDTLHHEVYNSGETFKESILLAQKTWKEIDGLLMVDYSSQAPGEKKGKHCQSINVKKFKNFLDEINGLDFDIMLEIKDKEVSAKKAVKFLK